MNDKASEFPQKPHVDNSNGTEWADGWNHGWNECEVAYQSFVEANRADLHVDVEQLAGVMAEVMNGGLWSTPHYYNGDQKQVWMGYAQAVLDKIETTERDNQKAKNDPAYNSENVEKALMQHGFAAKSPCFAADALVVYLKDMSKRGDEQAGNLLNMLQQENTKKGS